MRRWRNRTSTSVPHTAIKTLGKFQLNPFEVHGTVADLIPKLDEEVERGSNAETLIKRSRQIFWLALASPAIFLVLHVFLAVSVSAYPKNAAFVFFVLCAPALVLMAFKNCIDVAVQVKGAGPPAELIATRQVLEALPVRARCDIRVENFFPQIEAPENSVTVKTSETTETTTFCNDVIKIQAELPALGVVQTLLQTRTKKVTTKEKMRINRGKDDRGLAVAVIAPKPRYREFESLKLTHGRAFQLELKDSPQFDSALASLDSNLYQVERNDGNLVIKRVYDEPVRKENPITDAAKECVDAVTKLLSAVSKTPQ